MKKNMYVLFTLILTLVLSANVEAQSKKAQKSVKARAKELVKEGWKVEGVGSIATELARIESKRGSSEILVGSAYGNKKISLAKAKARNNAINEYAEYAKSIVKGRITSELSDISEEETDNVISGFDRLVLRELNGEISVPALVLIRDNGDSKDCQCFYIIDSNAAEKARSRAMKQAIEEAELKKEHGDKILEYINAGFNAQ